MLSLEIAAMVESKVLKPYHNPIIRGFNADPSIARKGADIFLITSTFEYFPGIPIYHTKDLISWKLVGHALTRRSQLDLRTCETGAGIWASTIRYRRPGAPGGGPTNGEGRWYICTAKWDRYRPQSDDRVWPRGFYVWTDDIWDSSSWSDPIYFDQLGFDQDLFWDDNGRVYLSTTYRMHPDDVPPEMKDLPKNFAIHIAEIDLQTGRSLTPPKMIRASSAGLGVSEGSHILKRGRYYYLLTAEGGTEGGHSEWCFRSTESPFGPWEEQSGNEGKSLWYNDGAERVQCTGHADIFEDSHGNWWAVLLGVRPVVNSKGELESYSPFGRESFLVPVLWKDDWPIFNHGKNVSLEGIPSPGTYEIQYPHEWYEDFSTFDIICSGWYQKKTPFKDGSYVSGKSGLQIFGGPYRPWEPEHSTMLLKKQTEVDGTFTTELDFEPTSPRWEAGTMLWHHDFSHASMGIRKNTKGERILIIRTPLDGKGSFQTETRKLSQASGPVTFTIQCSGAGYKVGFRELADESYGKVIDAGDVSMEILTQGPPVGLPFCGIMMGIYSFGELEPVLSPASFRYAKWHSNA